MRRNVLFLILFMLTGCIPGLVSGKENVQVDSLYSLLESQYDTAAYEKVYQMAIKLNSIDRNEKHQALINFAFGRWQYENYNYDSTIYYLQKAKANLGNDTVSDLALHIRDLLGKTYYVLDETDPMIHEMFFVLNLAKQKGDTIREATAMEILGYGFMKIHEYFESYQFLKSAERLFRQLNVQDRLSEINLFLGNLSSSQQKFKEALKYYRKSLYYAQQNKSKEDIAIALHNIATLKIQTNSQLDSALYYYKKVLEIEKDNPHAATYYTYAMIASTYVQMKKFDSAEYYLKIAEKYSLKGQEKESFQSVADKIKGKIAFLRNEYPLAIKYLKRSIRNKDINYENNKINQLISEAYAKQNNIDSAYHYLDIFVKNKQELDDEEAESGIIPAELEEKINAYSEELINQEKNIALIHKQRKLSRALFFLLLFIILLMILLVVTFLRRNKKIKQRNIFYEKLLEKSRDIIVIINKNNEITYRSPSCRNILGHCITEKEKTFDFSYIHPEDVDPVKEILDKLVASGDEKAEIFTFRILDSENNWSIMEAHARVLWKDPLIHGTIINLRDITEREEKEAKIIASEETFRNIFDSVNDAIYIQDREGKFLNVNKGAEKMYQYKKEEFIGKTPDFLTAPGKNDPEVVHQHFEAAFHGETNRMLFWGKRRNGEIFPKLTTFNPGFYFGEKVCLVTATDISERIKSEKIIKDNEQKLRAYLDNTLAGVVSIDAKGIIRFCNNSFLRMLSLPETCDIGNYTFYELLHPDDKKYYSPELSSFKDIRIRDNSGEYIWVRMTQSKIEIPGQETQYVLVLINVDNEIKYREQLSKNLNFIKILMSNIPNPVFFKDKNNIIRDCNKAFEKLAKETKENIIGKKTSELLKAAPVHDEKDKEVIEKGFVSYEFHYLQNHYLISKSALFDEQRNFEGIIESILDITEIKRTTEELKTLSETQRKILSLIAHDFRSIIAMQKSVTDFILSGQLDFEEIVELQKSMKPTIDSIFNMIDNILIWAKSQKEEIQFNPEKILVYPVIEENIKSLAMYAHIKNISLESDVPQDVMGYFDKTQLNSIIQNLISNALKYSHPGGKIFLSVEEQDDNIIIEVKDNGVGMDQEKIDKITNKVIHFSERGTENEKGSGLGMQIITDFIKNHGGELSIESKPGDGSKITIIFPQKKA